MSWELRFVSTRRHSGVTLKIPEVVTGNDRFVVARSCSERREIAVTRRLERVRLVSVCRTRAGERKVI